MFANLKKKIESEVGDLSRLTPANVLNRNNAANSSTLSSRVPSVSSLTSETPSLSLGNTVSSPHFGGGGTSSGGVGVAEFCSTSSVTPSRGSAGASGTAGGGQSLFSIKVKQLEEKLQAQESDFAWRLSTKDDEINNLNKTVEILTVQLRSQDSEVKKKLVRVQEDIDEFEGFSQQENAKLKHLLLNKEEEIVRLREERDKLARVADLNASGVGMERDALRAEVVELRKSLGEKNLEREELARRVEELSRGSDELGVEVQRLRGVDLEVEQMKLEFKLKCDDFDSVSAEVSNLRGQVDTLRGERDKLARDADLNASGVAVERDALQEEVIELRKRLGGKNLEREELARRVEELSRGSDELGVEVQRLRGVDLEVEEMKLKCDDYDSVTAEVSNLRGQVDALRVDAERTRGMEIECERLKVEIERVREEKDHVDGVVAGLEGKLVEVENEKDELIVNVSEVQARVDELEEEVRIGGGVGARVIELEGVLADKDKQLRQQSHALSDLRRSLAKELKERDKRVEENNSSSSISSGDSNHVNGGIVVMGDAVSLSGSEDQAAVGTTGSSSTITGAAMLPQYETDVNFMYLRSVLFKYLTSQDPQITSHLTRVVATLLHLTEDETNVLIQSSESRSSQHLLSHIIK